MLPYYQDDHVTLHCGDMRLVLADLDVASDLIIADPPGVVVRRDGRTVTAAARSMPYGDSIHTRSRLSHIVDILWHAWKGGQVVGALVRWMCGSTTSWFRLTDEPTRELCPMCLMAVARREAGPAERIAIIVTAGAQP